MSVTRRQRREQEVRYALTVLQRAVIRVPDIALEQLLETTDASIGEGPIYDREAWETAQAELRRISATARATLDYRRRLEAIAAGEEE